MPFATVFYLFSLFTAFVVVIAILITLFALYWSVGEIARKRKTRAVIFVTDDGPRLQEYLPQPGTSGVYPLFYEEIFRSKNSVIIFFVAMGCEPCETLMRESVAFVRRTREARCFAVLEGTEEDRKALVREYRIPYSVVVDTQNEIRQRLEIRRTPYGLLLDANGVVRMKGVVNSREHIEALVQRRGQFSRDTDWQSDEPLMIDTVGVKV